MDLIPVVVFCIAAECFALPGIEATLPEQTYEACLRFARGMAIGIEEVYGASLNGRARWVCIEDRDGAAAAILEQLIEDARLEHGI